MNEKKKVPKIRFPEFSGDWEEKNLGELMEVTSVKRIHQSDWTTEGVRFLRARDIVANFKNQELNDNLFISLERYKDYSKVSGKVDIDDLLVTGVGSIGVPMLIKDNEPVYFKDGNVIWFKNNKKLDGKFFYYSFTGSKIQKYILDVAGVGTVGTYTINSGKSTPIVYPSLPEQQKIGNFFKKLDESISLQKNKIDNLKLQKKSLLQKMFPKNGETIPEIRFPEFSGDWEYKKALELFVSVSDKNNSDLPVLSASQEKGMVLREDIGIDIKYDEKSLKSYKRVTPEQFVIHLRSFQGGFAYSSVEGITSPAYTVLDYKDKENHTSLYWKLVFNSSNFIKLLESITYGIRDGRSISFSDFGFLKFRVPTLLEQQKIGNFFKKLDDLILLNQQKLENLEKRKKGLLQKMFV